MRKKTVKESKPIYGAVCIGWAGQRVYTSFSSDLQELIDKAKSMQGIIEIERAFMSGPPIWERANDPDFN